MKLKFPFIGRHYRIEQFITLVTVLSLALIVTIVACLVKYINLQNHVMGSQAIYTQSFATSRTNVPGTVSGVYTSKNRTKTLLMLKFDDMQNLSTDANNYRAFLTNAKIMGNGSTLNGMPSGSIYMFGDSGYVGVYLVNKDGFKPQVLDLVIRNATQLKSTDQADIQDLEGEGRSFVKYDQFRVYFNPAGNQAKTLPCLNNKTQPTAAQMYNQAVVTSSLHDIHKNLDATLADMRINLNRIKEYTNRLSNIDGVNTPDPPADIKGDIITVKTLKHGKTQLDYKPASVEPGGWNFNWRDKTPQGGWLPYVIKHSSKPDMTYDQYFLTMRQNAEAAQSTDAPGSDNSMWTLTDGTLISNMDQNSAKYKNIVAHISALQQAWDDYRADKTTYQRQLLGQILHLEADTKFINTSSNINTNDNVITDY